MPASGSLYILVSRLLFIGGAPTAEGIEHFHEQRIKVFQPLDILDSAHRLEAQFVNTLGEACPEPTLVVFGLQPDRGLGPNQAGGSSRSGTEPRYLS